MSKLAPVALILSIAASDAVAAPVTLEEAIQSAEQHNLDLRLTHEQTVQAESLRGQAWSLLSPKLVGNADYTINQNEIALDTSAMIPPEFQDFVEPTDPIVVQPKHYWTASATVQQPLFNGQAVPLLIGSYKLAKAAGHEESAIRSQIHAGVAKSYYGLYAAREALKLAESAKTTAENQRGLAERQVDAGTDPKRAILQAELTVSRSARDVHTAQEQLVSAEEAFHRLTQLPRDTELVLPEPLQVPESLEQAIDSALRGRDEIKAADLRVKAARLQSRANWMTWLPSVDGRFSYVYSENTGFSDDKTFWQAVIQGQWVLWDGGYRIAKQREIGSQLYQTRMLSEQRRLSAESDVRTAWERFERAKLAYEAVGREQELADEYSRLAKLGFEAGTVTWMEVEQAELGAKAAKLNGVLERMNRDIAAIDLLVATGEYR